MTQINIKEKEGYSNTLILAMEKENLSRTKIAEILDCDPVHISWMKNSKYWSNVPLLTWNKVKAWVESREKLTDYHINKEDEGVVEETVSITVPVKVSYKAPKLNVPYEIEHGIPIPEKEKAPSLFPFDKMQVGDSFKVPIILNKTPKSKYNTLHTAIGRYRKTHPEQRFAIRYICKEECIRCWRIE